MTDQERLHLAQADRHIAKAKEHVARQKRVVQKLLKADKIPKSPNRCSTQWRVV